MSESVPAARRRANLRLTLVVAALSGFLALSYEIAWYRVISFLTWGVASSFGLLLGAYLLGIAVGARASAVLCKGRHAGDPRALRPLAVFVAVANVLCAMVAPGFAWAATSTDGRLGLVFVAAGAAMLGSVLPLVSHFGIEPDDAAGARLSYVYLANIVGSASGSFVTGFWWMDTMTLERTAQVVLVLGFGLSIVILAASGLSRRVLALAVAGTVGLLVLCTLAVPVAYDALWEKLLYKDRYHQGQRFAKVVENRSGVITVTRDGTVYGGGAYDGVLSTSLARDRNGIVRAYVIGALHPSPREVLMVGLASGSWAQVVANLPGVERLGIVEINPGYLGIIQEHPAVAGLLTNPKVSIAIDDGRRWLNRNPERRFDVIVMNTTWHWRGHATNLLSREFLELARKHLRPGGILYFNTTSSRDAQRTAAETFPFVLIFRNFVAASDSPISFDRASWDTLLSTMRIDGNPVVEGADEREALTPLVAAGQFQSGADLRARPTEGRIITDDNMAPEWLVPLRLPGAP